VSTADATPAPWSRPPFEPGHTLSTRHGAYSSRVLEPVARRLVDDLEASAPWWVESVDRAAVDAYARAEARVEVLARWTAEHGLLDAKGKPTAAADLLLRVERVAAEMRSRLGLDPLSRSRLGRDSAVAAAVGANAVRAAAEAGRQARERRDGGQ
jgi:hypothetical protein